MAVPARPTSGAPIGTDWGQVTHDTVVAQDLQSGTTTVALVAQGELAKAVVFPHPFASPPIVVVAITEIGGTNNRPAVAKVSGITASGFNAVVQMTNGVAVTLSFPVYWVATGPRA